MMRLSSPDAASRWLTERVKGTLRTDSRAVRPGDAFIAWPGHAVDGRRFVEGALNAGAAACLVEDDGVDTYSFEDARIASLAQLKATTGHIAHAFFGAPSRKLRVVAVTGTNGKTSTAWWTAQTLSLLGARCGVIGTLGVGEPSGQIKSTGLTTPDPVVLQGAFRKFVDNGFKACAIEASSIGLVEHRLAGTHIQVALFTNFTRDHLDYHGSMEAYWAAKTQLFEWPALSAAVINIDDEKGLFLANALRARGEMDVWTHSTRPATIGGDKHLVAHEMEYRNGGLAFTLVEGTKSTPMQTALIGQFNVSNLLGVAGGLRALGFAFNDVAAACAKVTPVPGRMQRITSKDGVEAVVDYAHTPDALEKTLAALRPLADARGGKLWCVFGCGGNRDATKRPMMGAIAERAADHVVATSDNPRNESPAFILSQIMAGMVGRDHVTVIEDRRAAIAHACAQADAKDVVLIAGKGHEDYQEIAGVKHPFSDVDEAQAALQRRTLA